MKISNIIVLLALSLVIGGCAAQEEFDIKFGIIDNEALVNETLNLELITKEQGQTHGFVIYPPDDREFEYSTVVHYSKDFENSGNVEPTELLRSPPLKAIGETVDFAWFDEGDPVGEYRVEISINGVLNKSATFKVTAPALNPQLVEPVKMGQVKILYATLGHIATRELGEANGHHRYRMKVMPSHYQFGPQWVSASHIGFYQGEKSENRIEVLITKEYQDTKRLLVITHHEFADESQSTTAPQWITETDQPVEVDVSFDSGKFTAIVNGHVHEIDTEFENVVPYVSAVSSKAKFVIDDLSSVEELDATKKP